MDNDIVAIEKGAFGSPSTKVANFTYFTACFQVFLSNTNNLCKIVLFQVFLSNTDNS